MGSLRRGVEDKATTVCHTQPRGESDKPYNAACPWANEYTKLRRKPIQILVQCTTLARVYPQKTLYSAGDVKPVPRCWCTRSHTETGVGACPVRHAHATAEGRPPQIQACEIKIIFGSWHAAHTSPRHVDTFNRVRSAKAYMAEQCFLLRQPTIQVLKCGHVGQRTFFKKPVLWAGRQSHFLAEGPVRKPCEPCELWPCGTAWRQVVGCALCVLHTRMCTLCLHPPPLQHWQQLCPGVGDPITVHPCTEPSTLLHISLSMLVCSRHASST